MTQILPPFTRALARRPARSIAGGLTGADLGKPDFERTIQQYDAYIAAIKACGLETTILPADESYPDGHYVEDTAIIFKDMAFFCRSGAPARQGEAESIANSLTDLRQIFIAGDDAYIDGGDVLFCADRVLIGLSERTTKPGAEQLKAALQSVQSDLKVDFVSFGGVLHLKSGITELAPGLLVKSPLIQTEYVVETAETIVLPQEESYAADVLPVNDTLLLPAGYPTLMSIVEKHYTNIVALDMSEFEKMDGGVTCLTLRY